uniref:Aryl hydrocarbon receptor n=1 Tax=Meleagris gallopavo TaxID=9103 RepID=G1MTC3_MELGA
MYAGRKRRKPAARTLRAADSGRSNPSKRHRERLNWELERLAALLPFPEEVAAGLDKLSILRLSAAFLRAKSFFRVALKNHDAEGAERDGDHESSPALGTAAVPEGELLLQALNGFVLVVTSEGLIFYSSHTIQDYLGFHQTDVMHQSIFKLIHAEDHQEFRRNLHWAHNPPQTPEGEPSPEGTKSLSFPAVAYKPDQLPLENSSFLERSFVCRFRCLLDNSSGFLALNLQGRLRFLHGQNKRSEDGSALPPQLALFAISTPLQPPSILEIRTKNMIFRTKHKLDFTPLACDAKGKIVLGYTEAELRMCGTGYQFIHAADMLYCAENHIRMMKTGESGLTVFRLLTKDKHWKWVQANARLVYKNSKPEYIIHPCVYEEGGEHLRKRSMHLPFTFATGEALLYQSAFPLPGFSDAFQSKGKISRSKKSSHSNGGCSQKDSIAPGSLLSAVLQQDKEAYAPQPAPSPNHTFSSSFLAHLEDTSSLGAGQAWSTSTAPVSSRKDSLKEEWVDLQQEDPLLATLNSLTINSDESCSNNELFSALESLGLNAEDLELLLLDEKMVMVNTDPDHTLSLSDFLTNNKILSYIHTTLGNKYKEDLQACPLPDMTSSPVGCSAACLAEDKDLQYPSQQTQQSDIVPGQAAALLWEHPLYDALAQQSLLPSKPTEAELPAGLQSRAAGEEGWLHFLQLSQVTPWTVAPSSHLGAPLEAWQLESDFPAVHPTQDVLQTFSLPSPGRGHAAAPSQPKHKAGRSLLMNRLCAHHHSSAPRFLPTSSSSPWQDYVSPLLTSSAQPDFYGISQDLISQHQDYLGPVPGPAVPAQGSNLNGLCSMDAVDSERSQEEMVPYSGLFPSSSYQLIPETHPNSIPSMYPFLSSSVEHFGSTGSVLEAPANSYGLYTSMLSQESSHKPDSSCVLPGSHTGLPTDSPAPPCKLHPHAEVLPDHPHAFSGDFYL